MWSFHYIHIGLYMTVKSQLAAAKQLFKKVRTPVAKQQLKLTAKKEEI